jgi:DegV family protein with EDD domain
MYNKTMKKLGIILDSFAGRDKKDLEKNGINYLPHLIYVNGKEYLDGVNITIKEMNEHAKKDKSLKSSLPSPKSLLKTFEETSKKYDDVLYLTMGSALSGTYQAALLISQDYKNVTVMDNYFVGPQMYNIAIKKAQEIYAKKQDIKEVIKSLKE